MKEKLTWSIFWALVGVFVVVASIFALSIREIVGFWFLIISGTVLLLLGAALIFLTVKAKAGGISDKFLILTGASSAGIIVSILLHNVIYGLFIQWFGADFWERIGTGDEPFFFILAIIVCPIGFLVGVVGSVILYVSRGKTSASKDT